MYTSALTLAMAASAMAMPTMIKRTDVLTPAPTCEQFTVAFTVQGGSLVSANAVANGTDGSLVLWGQRLSVYPGTPAYLNNSNPNPNPDANPDYQSLNFIVDDTVYGATVGDVGDAYGRSEDVYLERNYQQFEWLVNNGSINHKLYAATNGFYACNGTLDTGEEGVFLSFGVYNFTGPIVGPPAGCINSNVYQNFNVEGGLQPPSS